MKHPIQPMERDEHGILRFKKNKYVEFLYKLRPFMGYSLDDFYDLPYVSEEAYQAALKMAEKIKS